MAWDDLVTVEQGRKLLIDEGSVCETEVVAVSKAVGRICSHDTRATEDVPGFDRSRVDGYAVRSADTYGASESMPQYLNVIGSVDMGKPAEIQIGPGQSVYVPTGGMLPQGADAAIMYEHTMRSGDSLSVLKACARGDHVTKAGEDMARGSVIINDGEVITPPHVGALAGAGVRDISVYRQPQVLIISTGDEVSAGCGALTPGQVRDINGPALTAALSRDGCVADYLGVVCDDEDELTAKLRQASDYDMILLSGGSSVGSRDVTAGAIGRLTGGHLAAHGLLMKPGKPTIIGFADGKPIIGLPGHPVSALVVYEVVIRPGLRKMAGATSLQLPRVTASMAQNVGSAIGRTDYVRVRLEGRKDRLVAVPVAGHSAIIAHMARSGGLVEIARDASAVEQNEQVTVILTDIESLWGR